MKIKLTREWIETMAERERDLEVTVGLPVSDWVISGVASGDLIVETAELDVENEIDAARREAFKTNDPEKIKVYHDMVSRWFQQRHYRRLNPGRKS